MELLLDTHVFLWFILGDPQLSDTVRDAIQDPSNEVYLSVASVWEAVIKYQLGKLPLPNPPEIYFPTQRQRHQITSLEIDEGCLIHLAALPLLHRDPFDRILISQALQHRLTVATVDTAIRAYAVPAL